MGLPSKRWKKTRGSDREFKDDDDIDSDELTMDQEEEETEEEEVEEGGDDDDEDDVEEEDQGEEIENGDGQNTIDKDAEMEDLEKEYMNIRHQEQDILQNLKCHKDEDRLKGEAVKNQKALWDKTLEFRFLLQKVYSSSNRLPQEPVRSSFCDSDKDVEVAYSNLVTSSRETLNSLLELQEALLEKNPSIQTADGPLSENSESSKNFDVDGDEDWTRISQMHTRVAPFRNKSIDKWERKTQVTTGAAAIRNKLQAFNQNISEQVASYMRDPSRMIKQMQLKRSTVGIFGTNVQTDGDPELLDDSEFYQQLLKEFLETIDPTSSEAAFYALKKMQTKKRKTVDRRASKSRKIRYDIHEKIVNFMAPQPMDVPSMAPKLFENLFGLKTKKPTSVS
ncbi:hypothetical protein FNV43_RR18366 [Rhamnella rubrinervis]|uniref:Protein AATF n=1 Tax=Rhamnella rubrinervis TaxID=2594499 RepID=A0A8K0E4Z8_9ROSA|nr:hypothetical protein FNV43_RR18366 [Rhamnella rubrinervis]